jgi:hypothetical protein
LLHGSAIHAFATGKRTPAASHMDCGSLRIEAQVMPPTCRGAMLAVALISLAVLAATGFYRPQRGGSLIEDLRLLGWPSDAVTRSMPARLCVRYTA